MLRNLPALAAIFVLAACGGSRPPLPQSGLAAPIPFDADLWQAARETVDFLPLQATDPVEGTVETTWGAPHGDATQRFRIAIALDYARPYSTAVHVGVRREVQAGDDWQEVASDPAIAARLERVIGAYAQQLHSGQIDGK